MRFRDILRRIKKIDGWMSISDCRVLYDHARKLKKATIVEVGSYKGRSTTVLALASPTSTVYSVDPFNNRLKDNQKIFSEFEENTKGLNLIHIHKSSKETASEWSRPIDLIHIDANHSYTSVIQDIRLWKRFVKKGGVMLFHDYEARGFGVRQAVNKSFENPIEESGFGVVFI